MKVLLFSGGMDSTALAWSLRPERLTFINYGQIPAAGEERACRAISNELGLPLDVHNVDLLAFGSGAMAGRKQQDGAQPEFWPYRNQMLITLAAMAYETQGLSALIIGTVRSDRAHPDGRAAFVRTIDRLLLIQSNVRVLAPAAKLSSQELVRQSEVPLSLLGWTFSCHTGEWACGQCRGCNKHGEVMAAIG